MALEKTILEILNEGTIAALSTVPATLGGTECSEIDMTTSSQLTITIEGSYPAGANGDLTAHFRTSPVGGTDPAEWDTLDYCSTDLTYTAGDRVQKTVAIWCDPLYGQVILTNAGTTAVYNVVVTRTLQDVEPV